MKVALITDFLLKRRGAERVFENICGLFPTADIFTILHDPAQVPLPGRTVKTTFIQHLPRVHRYFRKLYPIYPTAIETFDLAGYDLVISNSSMWAHGVIVHPGTYHVCYCQTPFRYAWSHFSTLFAADKKRCFFQALYRAVTLNYIRTWDYIAAQKVDVYIANSVNIQNRIRKYYGRESTVIYPGIALDEYQVSEHHHNFYLIVSAILPYKRIEIAVDAFIQLGYNLKIIGDGPSLSSLMAKVRDNSNIELLGWISDDIIVKEYYSKCKAVIIPGEEDFCLVGIEAQAAGKPVIAFKSGGSLETIVDHSTGIFFDKQTAASLKDAVIELEKTPFQSDRIRLHAENFHLKTFEQRFISFLSDKFRDFSHST